ncbi:hydroxyethylthiazole kinase [Corynebacterium choanae]|uniref:Hydroxyethylthiazole kinase n=1 Tax=Corynebacterium choanae TaxID=1862358 RepID=A0A3G6J5Z3_9CORY|nr:hydroxyethylthiazole kinase [Corynebacterium choanae]AZA13521.1 Hydroxyethylthiazole kinase [Corynebacterium choanae]
MSVSRDELLKEVDTVCAAHRQQGSLVQCLTNPVVPQFTANVLLAAGASPAMCDNTHEAAEFCAIADAALVNLGNPTGDQLEAMNIVAECAAAAHSPWVMDPVAVGVLSYRTKFAKDLLRFAPTAIRGNASEISALAGVGAGGRGVDSTDSSLDAIDAARQLAAITGGIVAASGAVDVIVSRDTTITVSGGHPLMTLVVGTGCSLGALVASYLGAARRAGCSDLSAVVAAHAHAKAAGAYAAEQTTLPGSFAAAYLDGLYVVARDGFGKTVTIDQP